MTVRVRIRGLAFIILLFSVLGSSRPGPILDVDELTKKADLIVVGQVTSVREIGKEVLQTENERVPVRIMLGELRVDRVLKGTSDPPSLRFRFLLPEIFIGWSGVDPLSYRLFFLKVSAGELEFLSPYYPSLVAVPGVPVEGSSAVERVVGQLGAVLLSPITSTGQKQEAIYPLSRTKSPAATEVLRSGLREKDVIVQLSVTAALLERNEISGLHIAEKALLNPRPGIPQYLLHNLSYGISEGIKQEKAIPSLTRLLNATSPEVRRAAASALRHTGSRSAIDPLLSALGDSDLEVRYYSVVGLAEITGQSEWRPNMDDFLSDQQRYLNHWKDWARNR